MNDARQELDAEPDKKKLSGAQLRLVGRLVYGVERHEAEAIVERLMNGGKGVSESDNPIGAALEGIEEKRRQVEAELATMDSRKAALKEQLKQLTAAEKSLAKIAGRPLEVADPVECPECGKSLPSARGLKTHMGRVHKSAA